MMKEEFLEALVMALLLGAGFLMGWSCTRYGIAEDCFSQGKFTIDNRAYGCSTPAQ